MLVSARFPPASEGTQHGRQAATAHGKRFGLPRIDVDGALHVLELEVDETCHDVIASGLSDD